MAAIAFFANFLSMLIKTCETTRRAAVEGYTLGTAGNPPAGAGTPGPRGFWCPLTMGDLV